MPEWPDIEVYLHALERRIIGQELTAIRIGSPFVLRSVAPPPAQAVGRRVASLRRIGKRIAIGMDNDIWLVIHLMVAGRLHWRKPGSPLRGRSQLAAFDFAGGSLVLNEAGTKRRASLHVIANSRGLDDVDPGGLEIFDADAAEFAARLTAANHTLKRALTDPKIFSGIGNAYSDEILHRARLSPVTLTTRLQPTQIDTLFDACRSVLREWRDRLQAETGERFPERVTAFRDSMAVHGKYGQACPDCAAPVQRIRYANNETNYCARCQTGGRLLADRALSRLLKGDWPRHLDEL